MGKVFSKKKKPQNIYDPDDGFETYGAPPFSSSAAQYDGRYGLSGATSPSSAGQNGPTVREMFGGGMSPTGNRRSTNSRTS